MTSPTRLARAWAQLTVFVLLTLAVGCGGKSATAARKALPSSFPATKANWADTIDRVEFLENFSLNDYGGVAVTPLDTSKVKIPVDNTRRPVEEALERSTTMFVNALKKKVRSVPVTVASVGQPSGNVLVLRASIDEMNPGSQAARYWGGFGAGAAGTTISGELTDPRSGRTLLRFKDRRTTSGGFAGGSYKDVLNENLNDLGQDVGVLLSAFSGRAAK